MDNRFFARPVLNSPYEYPKQHWELDDQGQPTQQVIQRRRRAEYITPIPKPRKRKGTNKQQYLIFDEGKGLSTQEQQYDPTPVINELRRHVDQWRSLPNPKDWQVTPETARLLQHWRHHRFNNIRPFFCQVEAIETVIWLTEVAPSAGKTGKGFLEHLVNANNNANPELLRLALKLATGAGKPLRVVMPRGVAGLEKEKAVRNRDLDPQLIWRGKDEQDWSDLVVHAPPLYIQEKVHPKVLIDDLVRQTERAKEQVPGFQTDLFADFNGIPAEAAKTEFYRHDANWSNRMILGDSLQVMASLAEREGMRGKVQCIYLDPPYGIKFNSNFQWSTTSRDVKDGNTDHITREPEQVKAFRDTWRDGIHSYLTYLRDRLTVARDLLTDSGSIFVQIGDENVHRVRALMDEVFGDSNFISQIAIQKTGGFSQSKIGNILDHVLWYARSAESLKYRPANLLIPEPSVDDPNYVLLECPDGGFRRMTPEEKSRQHALPVDVRVFRYGPLQSDGSSKTDQTVVFGTTARFGTSPK